MTDREDIDMLAAEYVLGTLDRDERTNVAARSIHDPELALAIEAWQRRLSPLNELVSEERPSVDLFRKIEQELAGQSGSVPDTPSMAPAPPSAEIVQLKTRVARWRIATVAASAIAAALAGLLYYNAAILPSQNQQFVAVFNQGDQQPQFVMSIDLKTRELTIRPIAASAAPDKSYELWIVSDQIQLRSLGLLDEIDGATRKHLDSFDPAMLQEATFGISLEPKGGSPVGKPTGPALHGKLIQAVN